MTEQPKQNFMLSVQNSGWKYWTHFQAIQPNATAKGRRAFQPSYHGGTLPDDADGSGTPSSMGIALPLGDPMNVDSSALATTAEKRPLNSISLDSDSDPDDHGVYTDWNWFPTVTGHEN